MYFKEGAAVIELVECIDKKVTPENLHKYIREHRMKKGYTQGKLAVEAQVSFYTAQRVEQECANPTLYVLTNILDALNCHLEIKEN